MNRAVIIEACRTPIGRHQGGLSSVRPDDLAGFVMDQVVRRAGLAKDLVEEVYFGCANQSGEDGRNVARMGLLLAGFPYEVSGTTINKLCGSGLEAIHVASLALQTGESDILIAGGVESMTRAPLVMSKGEGPFSRGNRTAYDTALGWRFPNPKMEALFPLESMGETAENLVERYRVSRQEQDEFAFESHRKAMAAMDRGDFDAEIVPILLSQDEGPRRDISLEKLGGLRPAFRQGGSVTAGNSSSLNDGAAALLMMSETRARALGFKPLARIVAHASSGVDPRLMGIGPVPATRKALKRAGLEMADIDIIELNEAFAAQALVVVRELGLDPKKVNVHGGAIALGHPLGCTGARLMTTLLYAMKKRGGRYGLATLCVGVGQGLATIIERVK